MIPERTGDAKSARKGARTRLRNKQIGVLALAVASITRPRRLQQQQQW